MHETNNISEMELFFFALADKTRLRLLSLMREGEICVQLFVEVLGEGQPKISRHLAFLRNVGIVQSRREGKWIHYKIVKSENEFKEQLLRQTLNWFDSQEIMNQDYKKLVDICTTIGTRLSVPYALRSNTFVEADITENKNFELAVFLL